MTSARSTKLLSIRSSPGQSRGIFLLCLFQLLLKVKERQTNVTGRLFIRASCFSTSTIMAIMSTRPLEWDSPSLDLAEWAIAVLKLQLLRTQIRVGTWIAVLPLEYWGDTVFRKRPNNCTIRLIVAKIWVYHLIGVPYSQKPSPMSFYLYIGVLFLLTEILLMN